MTLYSLENIVKKFFATYTVIRYIYFEPSHHPNLINGLGALKYENGLCTLQNENDFKSMHLHISKGGHSQLLIMDGQPLIVQQKD